MPIAPPQTEPELHARRMWGAVLEAWAADCLRLRATGQDRPSPRGIRPGGPHPPLRPRRWDLHTQWDTPAQAPRWAA